ATTAENAQQLGGLAPTAFPKLAVSNIFTGDQTINGYLKVMGANSGIMFADGTTQLSAATGGGTGGSSVCFETSSISPAIPPGYTPLGTLNVGNFWTTVAAMPVGRADLAATALNGKIYAIGGYTSNNIATAITNTVTV